MFLLFQLNSTEYEDSVVMIGTLVVGLLTLDKSHLAESLLAHLADSKVTYCVHCIHYTLPILN